MAAENNRLGKYLLKRQLGRGGMGVVFLAIQEGLGREVALKVLPEQNAAKSADLLKRFVKEVSVCARLSHPNIVKVYDYGYEAGAYYYSMELLRATSLEDRIKSLGRIPIPEAIAISRDLVEAFRYYFPLGIVHRDLKPANIMMDEQGKAIITDFGLVKDLLASGITRAGQALGTPYYMSPEMVKARAVGPASDVFQFGVILYRMVTGSFPFQGKTMPEIFRLILSQEPEPPSKLNPDIQPALETLILNCLTKDPSVRYQDAERLSEDLEAAARRGSVARLAAAGAQDSPPPAEPEPAPPPVSRPSIRTRSGSRVLRSASAQPSPTQEESGVVKAISRASSAIDVGASAPAWLRTGIWVGLLLLLLPLAFAVALFRGGRGGYVATDVLVRAGVKQATLTWRSPRDYASRVEFSETDGAPKTEGEPPEGASGSRGGAPGSRIDGAAREASEPEGSTGQHSVVLKGLTPDREYRAALLFPDGSRSLDYRFRTLPAGIEPTALRPVGAGWQFSFRTAEAVQATLGWGEQEVRDVAPTQDHHLVLDRYAPGGKPLKLSFRDATGDPLELDENQLFESFRKALLPGLLVELTREFRTFEPGKFLSGRIDARLPRKVVTPTGQRLSSDGLEEVLDDRGVLIHYGRTPVYDPFPSGDAVARSLAEEMRQWLSGQKFYPALSSLILLGRGMLDGEPARALPLETVESLQEGMNRVAEMDRYAGLLTIPFASGAEDFFRDRYRVAYEPALKGKPRHEIEIGGNQIFAVPFSEYEAFCAAFVGVVEWKRLGPRNWTLPLEGISRARQAELRLTGVHLLREHQAVVTINRKLELRFGNAPAVYQESRNIRFPVMSQTFDPRFLREGPNEVHLEIELRPGMRDLGIKNAYVGGVQLVVE